MSGKRQKNRRNKAEYKKNGIPMQGDSVFLYRLAIQGLVIPDGTINLKSQGADHGYNKIQGRQQTGCTTQYNQN